MSLKNYLYEGLTHLSNTLTGPLTTTKFLEQGVLTPDEFVAAGDLLVRVSPTWTWESGDPKLAHKYLPKDKQYLITRNVTCYMRVSAFEAKTNNNETQDVETEDGEGGWVATHTNEVAQPDDEAPEIAVKNSKQSNDDDDDDDDDVPEIDLASLSFKGGNDNSVLDDDDEATLSSDNIIRTRTYDISICYDQFHQTPRVWLFGYDENGKPLKPEEVLQDISQDHVKKTVTIATHPHTNIPCAYIHPCKHAAVMKKIVQRLIESKKVPRVDQYLFLFLKFIHAAIPTMEYDNTIEMEL